MEYGTYTIICPYLVLTTSEGEVKTLELSFDGNFIYLDGTDFERG